MSINLLQLCSHQGDDGKHVRHGATGIVLARRISAVQKREVLTYAGTYIPMGCMEALLYLDILIFTVSSIRLFLAHCCNVFTRGEWT